MVAETNTAPEPFYTPEKVETILRNFQYMLDGKPHPEHDRPQRGRRRSPGGRIEEMMSRRADVEYALNELPEFTQKVLLLVCIRDQTLRAAGSMLGCSNTTVNHHKREGLRLLAWKLGWRDASIGWGEVRQKNRRVDNQ